MKFLENPSMIFLLKGNIFIAACSTLMTLETSIVLRLPLHEWPFYLLVFSATFSAYNVYYLGSASFKYHLHLLLAGLFGLAAAVFFIDQLPYAYLLIITLLSGIYMLPLLIRVRDKKNFSVLKLFLLVIVWVLFTFFMPASPITWNPELRLLGLYHINFMCILCLFFFMRDTREDTLYVKSVSAMTVLLTIQFVLSVGVIFYVSFPIGLIYFFMSGLLLIDRFRFLAQRRSDLEYLFFIDGKMMLQSIFVIIHYLFTHESGIPVK